MELFNIARFDVIEMIKCLELVTHRHQPENVSTDVLNIDLDKAETFDSNGISSSEELLDALMPFLMAIAIEYHNSKQFQPQFKPQSQSKQTSSNHRLAASHMNGFIPLKWLDRLRSLPIWLCSNDQWTACMDTTIYLTAKDSQKLPFQEYFVDKVLQLHDKMFQSANKCLNDGHDLLQAFILNNLRYKGKTQQSQGFEVISYETILLQVIIPSYQSIFESQQPSNAIDFDRQLAAVYLAFIFHCKLQSPSKSLSNAFYQLKSCGYILPTMIPSKEQARQGHVVWEYHGCRKSLPSKLTKETLSEEYHLGVEIDDSATNILVNSNSFAVFERFDWVILDPLVAALIFHRDLDSNDLRVDHKSLRSLFMKCDGISDWERFQEQELRVVDLFTLIPQAENQCDAPTLFPMVEAVRQGNAIRCDPSSLTSHQSISKDFVQESEENKDDDTRDSSVEKMDKYIPLWLLYPQDGVYQVNKGTFNTLQVLDFIYTIIHPILCLIFVNENGL